MSVWTGPEPTRGLREAGEKPSAAPFIIFNKASCRHGRVYIGFEALCSAASAGRSEIGALLPLSGQTALPELAQHLPFDPCLQAPGGFYFMRSWILAIAARAHSSSKFPPGAPLTPIPPIAFPPIMMVMPPTA